MRVSLIFLLLKSTFTMALRTMGELAHGGAKFSHHLEALRQMKVTNDAAKYLIDQGFYSAALVGTIADEEKRNDRLAKFSRANERILYHDGNLDCIGRCLGIGLQPQVNYPSLSEAVIANSESLTPRDLRETLLKVDIEVKSGAWLYSPFMPRRCSAPRAGACDVAAI